MMLSPRRCRPACSRRHDFTIKPAPSPADIVAQVIASTPDLATLAVSDKEFILQNGKPEDAAKVWDTIKGKSVELPDVTVVAATDTAIQASVSDDAVQSKTADFTFNMKEPLKTVPAPGAKVTLSGTYASYTVGGVTPPGDGSSRQHPQHPLLLLQQRLRLPATLRLLPRHRLLRPQRLLHRELPLHLVRS